MSSAFMTKTQTHIKEKQTYRCVANSDTVLSGRVDINIVVPNSHVTESLASCSAQCREQCFTPILSQLENPTKSLNILNQPNKHKENPSQESKYKYLSDHSIALSADQSNDIFDRQYGFLLCAYLNIKMNKIK